MSEKAVSPVTNKLYPEYEAGGFTREDNSIVFFTRVQGLLTENMEVLDFGAGSNIWAASPDRIRHKLMRLQGNCKKVTGIDVDPRVKDNPWLDEAIPISPGTALPFEDESFDMVVAMSVLEHIAEDKLVASEIARVLKPGGWFCAFTPNKWGYVGIGARMIPNRFHAKLLSGVFKSNLDRREEVDVYPVVYRMNTMGKLKSLFRESEFKHYSYFFNGPPSYHGERLWLAKAFRLYEFLAPKWFGRYLHIVLQKR